MIYAQGLYTARRMTITSCIVSTGLYTSLVMHKNKLYRDKRPGGEALAKDIQLVVIVNGAVEI